MSATPAPSGVNKKLLVGAGVGCGCLTLLAGIAVLVIVVGLSRSGPAPGPGPQPRPTPVAGPGPAPQPPQGQGEGLPDLQARLLTVKVQGEAENARPGAPSETFAQGEAVGAVYQWTLVRGGHDVVRVWLKFDGDRPIPVVEPRRFQVSEEHQGKGSFSSLSGAPAGDYAFMLGKVTGPQQLQLIVAKRFRVQ